MRQIFDEGQQYIDALSARIDQLDSALRRTHAALRCEDNARVARGQKPRWPTLDQEVYELLYGNGLPSQQVLAALLHGARDEIDKAWAAAPRYKRHRHRDNALKARLDEVLKPKIKVK